jgi:hypothetical protein
MVEARTVAVHSVGPDRWALQLRSTFRSTAGRAVELGSPGSNGRDGGGYGGFFWRLPPCGADARVWTDSAEGEEAVHGAVAPWLAYQAVADGEPFTLVAAPGTPETAADPWFVRQSGYPGFGSALAWDRPLTIEPDQSVIRELRVLVIDGHEEMEAGADLCRSLQETVDGNRLAEDE